MTSLIGQLFGIELYPELANIIVSNLDRLDYTMLHFTSKELRKYIVGKALKKYYICYSAVESGHLEVLKWTRENGCHWDKWAYTLAAKNGRLNVLKYLRKNGCPQDEWACAYAAKNGHLDVLKYLRKNGCPQDEWACAYAAKNGHLDVLKWLRENGCPWDEATKI
jgi:hypothetical protein